MEVGDRYEVIPSPRYQPLPDSTAVLSLSELAEKYAQQVPFRFRVINGFMSENVREPTIGVDEIYTLHLVKETRVVSVKSAGVEFEIPVNSSAKFGLIHDKKNHSKVYETVEEILYVKPLPKVIAVKNVYVDDVFSLTKNEILIVKDVVRARFGRSKISLRVYSLLSRKELILPKDCDAQFTINPYHTQLYLTDLIDNVEDLVPCMARIYPIEGSALSESITSRTLLLEEKRVHRSTIISLFRDNPTSKRKNDTRFIDIPTTININVSVIKTDCSDGIYQKIYEESQSLLNDYNPSKIQVCVDALTDDHYVTQAQLLAEIRKEKEKKELSKAAPQHYQEILSGNMDPQTSYEPRTPAGNKDIHKQMEQKSKAPPTLPPRISSIKRANTLAAPMITQKPPVEQRASTFKRNAQESHNSETHTSGAPLPTERKKLKSPPKLPPRLPPPITPRKKASHYDIVPPRNYDTDSTVSADDETDSEIKPTGIQKETSPIPHNLSNADTYFVMKKLNELQENMLQIMKQVEELQSHQSFLEAEIIALKTGHNFSSDQQEEYTISPDMRVTDVIEVLEKVGLSQYKEAFLKEAVDGDMFMILDEQMLNDELGVSSKLHRLRLLRLQKPL